MFVERQLTKYERQLTEWLLKNGNADTPEYIAQLRDALVVTTCDCGCASIDFVAVDDKTVGMHVLSDYCWVDDRGQTGGVFVFAISEQLAGLEVYSADGQCDVTKLPKIDRLVPIDYGGNRG